MLTVPPLADVGIPAPVESADTPLVSWTNGDASGGELAIVSVTEATTLLGIADVFMP
jgi:hypothetical protein